MRIRIQTHKPLPDVKAWFVPDENNIPETIYELKEELCRRVQALKSAQYHGQSLVLLLDDFELLNDSPFGAVRDGDLICIKQISSPKAAVLDVEMQSPQVELQERKRKRSPAPSGTAPVARKHTHAAAVGKPRAVKLPVKTVEAESGSESDTSSTSSSSSTSTSSSSSSTSSDSPTSSTSSSSSSSAPKPRPSKKPRTAPSLIPKPTTNVTHVPPGYGKPTTHSRNNRRRKRREHDKRPADIPLNALNATAAPPHVPVDPASVHLPPSPPAAAAPVQKTSRVDATPVYITEEQVMMSSMRNKNKKKGFKLSMASPIPQKIIFGGAAAVTLAAAAGTADGDAMHVDIPAPAPASASPSKLFNATSRAPSARLVPPSEIQATHPERLPRNMIVTSVDVEAGMWDDTSYAEPAKKKKRGKKKAPQDEEYYADVGEGYYADGGAWGGAVPADADEPAGPVVLDYGETDAAGEGGEHFDWDRAERLWDSKSTVLSGPEQIVAGALVGWKALAINPRTFSPEVLLSVAHVVQPPDSTAGKGVLIRQIQRPTDTEHAFAFGFAGSSGEGGQGEEEEDYAVEWQEVLTSEWRLLDL
ncbi:hypothetical protein HYPSUDRAFT_45548 [Hypholoma sublateritium FD-334 SS-4]|uniref:Uncharacterized protein n=1 Tax=Hypholoma sublateritium (strain FD-334 SS-4) TaxID=945553 RepID=A0A0D2NH02_HYPSF|nr:hypothetical protein HYPSUDRAFT_45548 [Hypholoma sublateritium FD-334 SS-4]